MKTPFQGYVEKDIGFRFKDSKLFWKNKIFDHIVTSEFIDKCSIMSETNCSKYGINVPSALDFEYIHRPPRYNRSGIIGFNNICVDLKGCGARPSSPPADHFHKNGLFYLHDALYEVVMQITIDKILTIEDVKMNTIKNYAIIQLPVIVPHLDFGPTPACVLARQFHSRYIGGADIANYGSRRYHAAAFIEALLRKYDLTSCNNFSEYYVKKEGNGIKLICGLHEEILDDTDENRKLLKNNGIDVPLRAQTINVQFARNKNAGHYSIVDFGHYRIGRKSNPNLMINMALDRIGYIGDIYDIDDVDCHFFIKQPTKFLKRINNYCKNSLYNNIELSAIGKICLYLSSMFLSGEVSHEDIIDYVDVITEEMTENI